MSDLPDPVSQAEAILGYSFTDAGLMRRALTHASAAEDRLESNERMEFLGDAVLGLVACQRIYELYPDLLEGEMTKIKSVAVSRKICAVIARQIGLEDLIILGKGIRGPGGQLPQSLAAAAIESTIAAVYLDGGLAPVYAWLAPLLDAHIEAAYESGHQQNYKSVLQQHAQRRFQQTPEYVMLSEDGPDHAKTFLVAVRIDGRTFEPGKGASKKQAEQKAALIALQELEIVANHEDGSVRIV
jgi:ribonuclease-3